MQWNIYVVRQIRMSVDLKLSCITLKFDFEMHQINLLLLRQTEIDILEKIDQATFRYKNI